MEVLDCWYQVLVENIHLLSPMKEHGRKQKGHPSLDTNGFERVIYSLQKYRIGPVA
jgi:hypothetical protein